MRRFSIAPATIQIYVVAGTSMIVLGIISILAGLILLTSEMSLVNRGSSSYSRSRARGGSSMGLMGLVALVGGAGLAFGSRTPFHRAVEARNNFIELSDEGVTCSDAGLQRSFKYSEVVDITQTETTLILSAKGKGSLSLTNEYEDFDELVSTLRSKCGYS